MGSPGGSVVKNLPAVQKLQIQSLGWEDPLEKEMATHSSVLAWRIPGRGSLVSCRLWGSTDWGLTDFIFSQSWKLEVQDQDVGRGVPFEDPLLRL